MIRDAVRIGQHLCLRPTAKKTATPIGERQCPKIV
jgi:hypothetical protein